MILLVLQLTFFQSLARDFPYLHARSVVVWEFLFAKHRSGHQQVDNLRLNRYASKVCDGLRSEPDIATSRIEREAEHDEAAIPDLVAQLVR